MSVGLVVSPELTREVVRNQQAAVGTNAASNSLTSPQFAAQIGNSVHTTNPHSYRPSSQRVPGVERIYPNNTTTPTSSSSSSSSDEITTHVSDVDNVCISQVQTGRQTFEVTTQQDGVNGNNNLQALSNDITTSQDDDLVYAMLNHHNDANAVGVNLAVHVEEDLNHGGLHVSGTSTTASANFGEARMNANEEDRTIAIIDAFIPTVQEENPQISRPENAHEHAHALQDTHANINEGGNHRFNDAENNEVAAEEDEAINHVVSSAIHIHTTNYAPDYTTTTAGTNYNNTANMQSYNNFGENNINYHPYSDHPETAVYYPSLSSQQHEHEHEHEHDIRNWQNGHQYYYGPEDPNNPYYYTNDARSLNHPNNENAAVYQAVVQLHYDANGVPIISTEQTTFNDEYNNDEENPRGDGGDSDNTSQDDDASRGFVIPVAEMVSDDASDVCDVEVFVVEPWYLQKTNVCIILTILVFVGIPLIVIFNRNGLGGFQSQPSTSSSDPQQVAVLLTSLAPSLSPSIESFLAPSTIDDDSYSTSSPTTFIALQYSIMKAFFAAAGGEDWVNSEGWGLEIHETICQWNGIECNRNAEVTELKLRSNNLTGNVSDLASILSKLPTLVKVDLSYNELSGDMNGATEKMAQIRDLKNVNLRYNYLEGGVSQDLCERFDGASLATTTIVNASIVESVTVDCVNECACCDEDVMCICEDEPGWMGETLTNDCDW